MPHDSSKANTNNASNTAGRPLMPTLASNRTVRSPLTPRLAVQHGNSNATAPSGSRRSMRSDISSAKSPPASKDDLATPVKAFINTNITPRSSSRKSRVDSAQSTPSLSNPGTPSGTPKVPGTIADRVEDGFYSVASASQPTFNTGAVQGVAAPKRPMSMHATAGGGPQGLQMARPALPGRATSPNREASPMFFHANDAKSQEVQETSRPLLKKGPSFFYANGNQDETTRADATLSPPASLPSPPLSSAGIAHVQLFRADPSLGRPMQSPPMASPPIPSSMSETQFISNTVTHMPNLRPASPTKETIHLSYRKGASQIMRPASILPPRQTKDETGPQRRPSLGPSKRSSHTKTSSLSSIDSASNASGSKVASRRSSLNVSQQQAATDAQTKQARRVSGVTAIPPRSIQMPPLIIDAQAPVATPGSVVTPLSPSKTGMTSQMTELAAQARRERKVMDLEISNSSLLAINRQLEREVRKQKAELRRYRRLTRAGRLSVATAGSEAIEGTVDSEASDSDADDQLGGAMGMQSDDEDDDDDLSESDESALSPAALAEHDQKRIAKDEKRLRLDLSKHRQLLVDSQKMNQSLRRCLGWTEELINEGKKALSYRVRVSDVKLGGRVLRRDDDFEDGLEESHLDNDAEPQGDQRDDSNDDDDEEQYVAEEKEAENMGDIMSLMSPWMRSGPQSGTGTPIMPADSMGGALPLPSEAPNLLPASP